MPWSRAGQDRWLQKTWSSVAVGSHLHQHEAATSWSVPSWEKCRSTLLLSRCHSLADTATLLHSDTTKQVLTTVVCFHAKTTQSSELAKCLTELTITSKENTTRVWFSHSSTHNHWRHSHQSKWTKSWFTTSHTHMPHLSSTTLMAHFSKL